MSLVDYDGVLPLWFIISLFKTDGKLNEEDMREIAGCCLLGLLTLHNRGIIHQVSRVEWT